MVRIPSKLFRIKCEPGSGNCDVGESTISKMVNKPVALAIAQTTFAQHLVLHGAHRWRRGHTATYSGRSGINFDGCNLSANSRKSPWFERRIPLHVSNICNQFEGAVAKHL